MLQVSEPLIFTVQICVPYMLYRLNLELDMYAPIPDASIRVYRLRMYCCSNVMHVDVTQIKYDKFERSERRKTNAEKQQVYRKGDHLKHSCSIMSHLRNFFIIIALADLQSIQKSHVLWQELNHENISVSINFYVYITVLLITQKQFYVPREMQNSNFLCHIAIKDKDQQLQSYVISAYQTIKVCCM